MGKWIWAYFATPRYDPHLHIADRKLTLTLQDIYRLIGLPYGGQAVSFRNLPNDARLDEARAYYWTGTINLGELYKLSNRAQAILGDRDRMAQAFILHLLGTTIVDNVAWLIFLGYLTLLVDFGEVATYD